MPAPRPRYQQKPAKMERVRYIYIYIFGGKVQHLKVLPYIYIAFICYQTWKTFKKKRKISEIKPWYWILNQNSGRKSSSLSIFPEKNLCLPQGSLRFLQKPWEMSKPSPWTPFPPRFPLCRSCICCCCNCCCCSCACAWQNKPEVFWYTLQEINISPW